MIELVLTYKYLILFPLALIEGPFIMMICGFLVKLGYFNFTAAYTILVAGDLLSDMVWYGVGHKFGMNFVRKFGNFLSIREEDVAKVQNIFLRHHSTILFISKITMGLGFALVTLITAGLAKIPFRQFVFWNAFGGLLWTGALMAIGFYLGDFYLKVDGVLNQVSVVALLIMIFIVLISITRYIRQKFSRESL